MTPLLPALPDDFPHVAMSGVFRTSPSSAAKIADAAALAGFDVRRIDLHACRNKAEVIARIAEALEFPDWFGHNWDALADCLSDLNWLAPASARLFLFEGCSGREEALPVLLEILQQTCCDWSERALGTTCVFALAGADE